MPAAAALRSGLYDRVLWQATSALEAAEIESFLRSHSHDASRIAIASDLPNRDWFAASSRIDAARATKVAPTKFLFLSRICRKKNLEFALDALASLSAPAELHIYEKGPHGLGLGKGGFAFASWPERCAAWMRARQILNKK